MVTKSHRWVFFEEPVLRALSAMARTSSSVSGLSAYLRTTRSVRMAVIVSIP